MLILKGFSNFVITRDEASLSLKQLDLMVRWVRFRERGRILLYSPRLLCVKHGLDSCVVCFELECGNSSIVWDTTQPN